MTNKLGPAHARRWKGRDRVGGSVGDAGWWHRCQHDNTILQINELDHCKVCHVSRDMIMRAPLEKVS